MQTIAIFVLILQPLIFYRRHLFRLTAHIPFDLGGFHLPLAAFIERSVRQHMWPFWNPLEYCGVPIHADIQAQLFYPPAWSAILMDLLTGGSRLLYWLEWLVPIHMIIGGIGAYFLLRQFRCSAVVGLFGATVFQIGPFFVSQAQHLGSISAAAWFPVILLCLTHLAEGFNSRWLAGLALGIAMSVLGGFPATAIVILVLSGLFCAGLICARLAPPRFPVLFALGCLLGSGIAAIQLIPTIQLSTLSMASLRYKWLGGGGGMHWESLASFVWPNYYRIFSAWDPALYKLPYQFTFLYTFCGHAALVLIVLVPLFVRRSKPLFISAGLFILSAVWMLGENTPVYPAIYKRLPHFLQNALYPESALLGFSLFAAIAAALVLTRLEPKMHRVLLVILVAANSWNLIRVGANKSFNTFDGSYAVDMAGSLDESRFLPENLRTLTRARVPPLRIELLSDVGSLSQGRPSLFELSSAEGDNPFLLLRYYDLRRTFSNDFEWSRRQFPRALDTPWIPALNVGYVIENAVRVFKVNSPMPRFYLQTHIVPVHDEQEALANARNPAFNPTNETIVEGLAQQWMPDQAVAGSVRVLNYENNRIDLDVQTSGRVLLVTSEALYPSWTATVNDRPAAILATNVAFRGIPLEAGENHIVMRYFPRGLMVSLVISVLSLGLTLVLIHWID